MPPPTIVNILTIVDVEYCGDPRDMFFANVIPFEYLKHQ